MKNRRTPHPIRFVVLNTSIFSAPHTTHLFYNLDLFDMVPTPQIHVPTPNFKWSGSCMDGMFG